MRTHLLLLLVVLSLIPTTQRVEGAHEGPIIPPELRRQALSLPCFTVLAPPLRASVGSKSREHFGQV